MLLSLFYDSLFRLFVLSFYSCFFPFFFFNDTATTEIYTLSLHDALPIFRQHRVLAAVADGEPAFVGIGGRSEEHTSELQSRGHLVCRLLLEKTKQNVRSRFNSDKKENMQLLVLIKINT